jgi:hypothetical protein
LPRRIVAAYDDQKLYCLQSTNVINLRPSHQNVTSIEYLLGLVNSTQLPICLPKPEGRPDKAQHDRTVSLVERMLDQRRRLAAAKNPNDKTRLQSLVDATDREIDRLVYDLYGLTEEEIMIVEGTTNA